MSAPSLRWCLVGASDFAATSIAPAIAAQPDAIVASVVSGDRARAQALADGWDARGYDDLAKALDDPAIDVAYVSSINSRHYEHALAAINAGKHVLCEKPLALSVAHAQGLVDAAARAGVVFATNHHMRNSVPHELMRRAIAAGDIGTPVAAIVQHAVQLPAAAQRWRTTDPDAGAGVALDITVHDVDSLRFVLDDDPTTVQAYTSSGLMTQPGIDETITGTAEFGRGTHVGFLESFVTGHTATRLDILGTDGALLGTGIQSMSPVGTLTHVRGRDHTPVDLGEREDLYTVGVRRFQAAVRGEGTPAATGADGVWSVAFALAALRSARTGRRENVQHSR
ncbi:Gfo/Idh/MocA family protein [Nocardia sp. CWNU-33]|uniref:Gfo/Idh/MocA family protein n=1 Tax=Nocardia sp. CWNU-33 TaxID=3392117 RepID=UPI00398F0F6B